MTSHRVYAYTHPGYANQVWSRTVAGTTTAGTGLIKVGMTTRGTGVERIKEQTRTAFPDFQKITVLFDEDATRTDGSFFTDYELHRALTAVGAARRGEWFEATESEVRAAMVAVRSGKQYASSRTLDYNMRPEQERAVIETAAYFQEHEADSRPPRFLWNAKMRFGKTHAAYQLAREMGWTKVLVLTYKPAVKNSWKDDLLSHVTFDEWQFCDRDTNIDDVDFTRPYVWFSSLQDALGKGSDDQIKEHNLVLHLEDWDGLIVDEYHYGAWREASRELYDPDEANLADNEQDEALDDEHLPINAKFHLFLSGTPFRALSDGEFNDTAIFNWSYIDEQEAKRDWDPGEGKNLYASLPQIQMYTYEVPQGAEDEAERGEFDGFDLNTFFKAKKLDDAYRFQNETRVVDFLDMIRGKLSDQMKADLLSGQKPAFPFEDARFNGRINHSVWYLPDVASCYAMAGALSRHPFFSTYAVRVVAGSRTPGGDKALTPVQHLIDHNSQTIVLSCGKLMTGVTVPQWSAILMLRSMKSPESYFQSAFRVQSPWTEKADGSEVVLKDPVFVFDFDPNRALSLVAEYGSKIATAGNEDPKKAIQDLLNFLPIFGYDGASMQELDANEVLNWATAGTGATMLAKRWRDHRMIDLTDVSLTALLADEALVASLERMEDFRSLRQDVGTIISVNKKIAKVKTDRGEYTPENKKERDENRKRRKVLRDKLLKFVARIPVFLYLTDFREERLEHVIESLDPTLFTRVTGLSIDDFRALKDAGVFNTAILNAAIYQFRIFEDASLRYVSDEIGLWDHTVKRSELEALPAEQAVAVIEEGNVSEAAVSQ